MTGLSNAQRIEEAAAPRGVRIAANMEMEMELSSLAWRPGSLQHRLIRLDHVTKKIGRLVKTIPGRSYGSIERVFAWYDREGLGGIPCLLVAICVSTTDPFMFTLCSLEAI